jgi:flagellar basal-body rod protein FlgG
MIRALYTAASGMNAQQANIDTVANNLANVNTAGFKKSRMEFQDLVYQQMTVAGSPTSNAADQAPVGLEIGLGTRPIATARDFATGNLKSTSGPLDIAIEGHGFFQVTMPSGEIGYTRAGTFHLSAEGSLVTPDGYQVQPGITIPKDAVSVSISKDGVVSAQIAGQQAAQQVGTLELASFQNAAGLRALGGNLFAATSASGEPTTGVPGTEGMGTVAQGFIEDSNVSVVEEMVNMILGQRAYEANSRVVKAADEMLSQVNNLAR